MSENLKELIHTLPKAELHVHIEGTLEPQLMWDLAQKHDVILPYDNVASIAAAYEFDNLQSFLDLYYHGNTSPKSFANYQTHRPRLSTPHYHTAKSHHAFVLDPTLIVALMSLQYARVILLLAECGSTLLDSHSTVHFLINVALTTA